MYTCLLRTILLSYLLLLLIPAANAQQPDQRVVVMGPFTVDITSVGTICQRNTGRILAIASGGTAPYTFSLDGGSDFKYGYFINLLSGNYTLTIKDANGVTASGIVNIPNTLDAPRIFNHSQSSPSTCTSSDGSLTYTNMGGTPPYTYSWDQINWQTSPVFTGLAAGSYRINIKDNNGCTGEYFFFNIQLLRNITCEPREGLSTYSENACTSTGMITVQGMGSYPPFSYSLDGVNWQTTGIFSNLGPGLHNTYTKDSRGNINMRTVHIARNCNPVLSVNSLNSPCNTSDGSITASVLNGTSPFLYTIDGVNFQASNSFFGLTSGRYRVVVKDAQDRYSQSEATIEDNCAEVSANPTSEHCGRADGTISAQGSKGTPPYEYSLDGINFQSSNTFTGLSAGNYTVTLRDRSLFKATVNITVGSICLQLSSTVSDANCGRRDGAVTLSGSGGVPPYEYSFNGMPFIPQNTFQALLPGSYTAVVRDASGETGTVTVVVGNKPGPTINITMQPADCNSAAHAIIQATNGTPPYRYSLDGTNWQITQNFYPLDPWKQYTGYVRDANGCIDQQDFRTIRMCLQLTATVTPSTCGRSTGIIRAVATDGEAPYRYSLDAINWQASGEFTGLAPGNYLITALDVNNSIKGLRVVITSSCPAVQATIIHETCSKGNGQLNLSGSGGMAPYRYSLDGNIFQTTASFNNLPAGTYTIHIRDADNITTSTSAIIQNTPGPQVQHLSSPATCNNNDGSLTLGATGNPPFQYKLNNSVYQASSVFRNIASGDHIAMVRDVNGCETSHFPVIALTNNLTVEAGTDLRICEGSSITIPAISNATRFEWMPGNHMQDASKLSPTVSPTATTRYFLTASKGPCQVQDNVLVTVDPAPVAQTAPGSVICPGQNTTLQGSGGIRYNWSPATYLDEAGSAKPRVLQPKQSITYRLRVSDNKNCNSLNDASVTVQVTAPPKIDAGPDLLIARGQPWQLQVTDLNNSVFSSFSWQPTEGLSNPHIPNPVAKLNRSITYRITASTSAGCTAVGKLGIKVNDGPEFYVASAFTPNGDGKNDVLKALPVGIKTFKYFAIFNRYGQKIFSTNDAGKGWDGSLSTREQGVNSFVWMAEGIDHSGRTIQRKGIVILVR